MDRSSLLAPYFAGADFGLFKIPTVTEGAKKLLRIIGPVLFISCVLSFVPIFSVNNRTDASLASATASPRKIFPTPSPEMTRTSTSTSSLQPSITPSPSTHEESNLVGNGFQKAVLEVRRLPGRVQVEVLWRDLPHQPNLYLMTSDGNRYYDPKPVNGSGEQIIPVNDRITMIAIVQTPNVLRIGVFPTSGVEPGDPSNPIDVRLLKRIPEQ